MQLRDPELSGRRTRLRWSVIKCSQVTVASPAVITSPTREKRSSFASPWRGVLRRRCLAMETRNEFLHGTFLPPSSLPLPPSFSPAFPPASSILLACFTTVPTFLPCRFETRRSLPLGKSRRASFNEKLISRVKVDCFGEQDLPFLFLALVSPAVSDFAASLFSLSFRFLPSPTVSSSVKDARFAPHPFSLLSPPVSSSLAVACFSSTFSSNILAFLLPTPPTHGCTPLLFS